MRHIRYSLHMQYLTNVLFKCVFHRAPVQYVCSNHANCTFLCAIGNVTKFKQGTQAFYFRRSCTVTHDQMLAEIKQNNFLIKSHEGDVHILDFGELVEQLVVKVASSHGVRLPSHEFFDVPWTSHYIKCEYGCVLMIVIVGEGPSTV